MYPFLFYEVSFIHIHNLSLIHILSRSIRDSFKSVFRNFSLSIASILCTTITLILVAVAIFLSYNVHEVTTTLEHELTIVVYYKQDVTDEQKTELENALKTMDNVESYETKSKDEWKEEMQKESDTLKTTLDYLEENPLLDSVIVTVKNVSDLSEMCIRDRDYSFIRTFYCTTTYKPAIVFISRIIYFIFVVF